MTLSMVERFDTPTIDGVDLDSQVEAMRARIASDGPRLPLAEPVLDEAAAREAARKAVADLVDKQTLDAVLAQVKGDGLRLTGPGGFLSELVRAVLERGLQAELAEHLGYGKHEAAGRGSGNSRNGSTAKTVQTEVGPIDVRVPRDRAGTFTPVMLPKNARRLGGLSDVVISLYADRLAGPRAAPRPFECTSTPASSPYRSLTSCAGRQPTPASTSPSGNYSPNSPASKKPC